MTDPVIINYIRPGKEIQRYIETRMEENPLRIKTVSRLAPDFSRRWCEETWWANGYIPQGVLIASVVKYIFLQEWFSVMQVLDKDDQHLGYYVDIIAPIKKIGVEYAVTDLFLDLWISPAGKVIELDRDEFEQAYQVGMLSSEQYVKAGEVFEKLKQDISSGKFFLQLR